MAEAERKVRMAFSIVALLDEGEIPLGEKVIQVKRDWYETYAQVIELGNQNTSLHAWE